ncbi:MAG: SPOR domain-containing protein [Turneriella sp.]|nr:SPOR domain-containing protein [Turneriella sp.]
MKQFYVVNLDLRRIVILAGALFAVLGLALFLGMSLGRAQGERSALQNTKESELTPAQMGFAPTVPETKPMAEIKPEIKNEKPPAVEPSTTASEIPLREDPLVQGPPKVASKAKPALAIVKPKKTLKRMKAQDEPEISGQTYHTPHYTIQVAAFRRMHEAEKLVARLREEGIQAKSEKRGAYYLVTVGRSRSREKLNKALARLKELDYDAYIRKVSKSEDT